VSIFSGKLILNVIPSKAGIMMRLPKNNESIVHPKFETVDSRLRGNDGWK
jgi:hypothetical protein